MTDLIAIIESVRRHPSPLGVWMVNRLLSSDPADLQVWIDLLKSIEGHPNASDEAKADARDFLDFQRTQHPRSDFEVLERFDPSKRVDPHGDQATLNALAAAGADLSVATHFIHYLYFPDEEMAMRAGKELAEELGYRVRGFAPEGDQQSWSVWAETEREPSLANVQRMRQVMEISAGRHGGSYDGWEAAVAERSS